ncbi:MAG: tyrosine--tRNA ligase [Deltaproteobacteria bacterium]|nr:MAG: tyrosine--tRNA ligase [Deltaproteobacteria bacterium]
MQLDFFEEWHWRTIIQNVTKEEEARGYMSETPRTIYCGFDPTADSLHVGSLMPLLALRRLQLAGHRPVVLVGGGTGLIGDPSGKKGERSLNEAETVAQWSDALREQMSQFVDFDCGDNSAVMVNNFDWLSGLSTIEFLRDVGKHFSVNAMMGKESVRARIQREGEGISYTEFSYMILQSYDFLRLLEDHNCTVQIGGSDQWGNITAGIDLIRRFGHEQAYGITLPLVVKADGTKFGKTEDGTIWLDPKKTSPYEMYQFWLNTADADVSKFLRYFTFLSKEEIEALDRSLEEAPEKREAQRTLAQEVTSLVHGEGAVEEAETITKAFFTNSLHTLSHSLMKQAFQGAPKTILTQDEESVELLDLLVRSELAPSKGRARRLVQDGAVSVNGEKVRDVQAFLQREDALHGEFLVIKKGKKNYHIAEWQAS